MTADKTNQVMLSYREFTGRSLPEKGILFDLNSDMNVFVSCCHKIETLEKSEEALQAIEKVKFLFPLTKVFKFAGQLFSSPQLKAFSLMESMYEDFKKKDDLRKDFITFLQNLDESTDYHSVKEFTVD